MKNQLSSKKTTEQEPVVEVVSVTTPTTKSWFSHTVSRVLKYLLLFAPLLIFVWQIGCEARGWTYGPAWALVQVWKTADAFFEAIGRWIAYVFSYLSWLEWKHVKNALWHLAEPSVGIAFSAAQIVRGYVLAAREYAEPSTIYVGTLLGIAVILLLLGKYTSMISRLRTSPFGEPVIALFIIVMSFVVSCIAVAPFFSWF